MSLFELPVSRGARLARVIAVLALDAVLVGAGAFMIVNYLHNRAERRAEAAPAKRVAIAGEVEVLSPQRQPSPAPAGEGKGGGSPAKPEPARPDPAKPAPQPSKPDPAKPQPSKPPGKPQPPGVVLPPAGPAEPPPDEPVDDGFDELPAGGLPPEPPAGPADAGEPPDQPADQPPGPDDAGPPADEPDDEQVNLSAEQVRSVVDQHLGQLRRCYERASKTASPDEPLEGRIDIQFAIMPSGIASNVRTVSNTTNSDELADCVAGLIESWQFPSPGGEAIEFVWPFVFKAPR